MLREQPEKWQKDKNKKKKKKKLQRISVGQVGAGEDSKQSPTENLSGISQPHFTELVYLFINMQDITNLFIT